MNYKTFLERTAALCLRAAKKTRIEVADAWSSYLVVERMTGNGTLEKVDSFLLRSHLIERLRASSVNLVLDVGAHCGGFLSLLRKSGYSGSVVCFEPTQASFNILRTSYESDRACEFLQVAVGDRSGELRMNIFEDSVFNSSLAPKATTTEHFGQAVNRVAVEDVPVIRLDDYISRNNISPERVFLKIDVQGMEQAVLDGAGNLLHKLAGVLLEGAFDPLYMDGPKIHDLVDKLAASGLKLAGMYPVNRPADGFIREYDCLFSRAVAVNS